MTQNDADTGTDLVYTDGMTLSQKIGSMIRDRRKNFPGGVMSQKELSEKSGIAETTLSSYERGVRTPSLNSAVKLAKILYLDLNILIRDVELPKAS